jgi:molybdenum cofactor synthesis domain-containing protein
MATVNAEIVAIGSELLLGQIVDTNSAWMAQRLAEIGVNLFYKTIVGDNAGRMREIISRALERSNVVITSGGIGPTEDDLTRETELAYGIRAHSHADLGLAVRAIPDPERTTQNLSPGKTYMAVADAKGIHTREYNFAGRGHPDLSRMVLYALNLVRRTLEGTL